MNDKELLELAAKACGFDLQWMMGSPVRTQAGIIFHWNPLGKTDIEKGQCLQMEIDLHITTFWLPKSKQWDAVIGDENGAIIATFKNADRQRASTMAAAELGRAMG